MKPLRGVQAPPTQVPQVTANGAVLVVAQYSWGSGTSRRVWSPYASAVPIVEVPYEGETIRFQLATTVRPSLMLVSAYSRLEQDGMPDISSETAFDCEAPGSCDIAEGRNNVTILVTAPDAQMVTLRTAFDVPDDTSETGLDEPFTASWVVKLVP